MGLSTSKQKATAAPTNYARPQIDAAGSALNSTYQSLQPTIQGITGTINAQLPGLASKAFGDDPGLGSAINYNTGVLNGDYLGEANPYLRAIADETAGFTTSRINSAFGAAGRTGGPSNVEALARGISSSRNNLFATEYGNERNRMSQAAALAPTLNSNQYAGLGAYLTAANAAVGIPSNAAASFAGGLGSLYSPYQVRTGTATPSTIDQIGKALDIGKAAAGFF